jgi:hypothetical protein
LCACEVHSGAVVVFRQAMFSAELVSAVGTPKRKKRFLPTLATFHTLRAPSLLKKRWRLYLSLRKSTATNTIDMCQTLKAVNSKLKSEPKTNNSQES